MQKFIPFKDVTVNCLCDIDEGKDLGVISIEKADQKSLEEIQEYVNKRALSMKAKQGFFLKNNSIYYKNYSQINSILTQTSSLI